ncbi:hypothetical protein, partial [Neglectibacter sp. X4]|uniref:hypothetical protein n=1 Tax=Neglectibacter sp. X4 TaxID=2305472 RepID=UPI001412E959
MRFLKHLTYLMMPLRVASIASIAYSTIIFCQGIIPAIETIVLAEIIDNLELNKVRTVFFVYIYIILIFIDWIVP